jgi:transglutaminase-like putative cysteine protease
MEHTIIVDDQAIAAGFFNEGKWLSEYVTPTEPDILKLWEQITAGLTSKEDKIVAAWDWVANQVKYKEFIRASISVEGKTDIQHDFWQTPSMVSRTHVGNCANKAFLLSSLLRNVLGPQEMYTVLGNLYNGKAEGHAWVQVNINGKEYIVESTRNDVPMMEVAQAERYEPVHYFNDTIVLAVPGKTVMTPFGACYSEWLRDYLQMSYINGGR